MSGDALVLVHPFPLEQVAGTTVLLRALLPEIRAADPGVRTGFINLDGRVPADALADIAASSAESLHVVGVNLHIERHLARSLALYARCRRDGVPAYLWAHDYWPHHERSVRAVVNHFGATLLASTATVRDGLAADGFAAEIVQVGIPVANVAGGSTERASAAPFVVGSAGRVVPRKRFGDVVRAFERAELERRAQVHLRLSPSLVYTPEEDDALLEAVGGGSDNVVIHREPGVRHDYDAYSVYVCASDYEGFSMTPIEAAYCGCPPLMSDIAAHREIALVLYPDDPAAPLFPPGDVEALARLLADEAATRRRRIDLAARREQVRRRIEARWSLAGTARDLLAAVRSNGGRTAR